MSENAEDCVKFSAPAGNYSPLGPVKTLLPGQTIDNQTATDIGRYHYRRSKFYQTYMQLEFDQLKEAEQSDGSFVWAYLVSIETVPFAFILSQREIVQSVLLTPVNSASEKEAKAAEYDIDVDQTTITIDGQEYFVNMNLPLHFNMDGNEDTLLNFAMLVVGQTALSAAIAGIAAEFGINAFKEAFGELQGAIFGPIWTIASSVMKAGYRFSTGFIGGMIGELTVAESVEAGLTAAGDEWAMAMAKLDKKTLCFSVAGTVVMAAVILFVEFVVHRSYQNVYIYNLTKYDMEFDAPYISDGTYENLPTNKVGAAENQSSGGFDLGMFYNGVAFDFTSASELHGLGYTLRMKLKDKLTGNVVKTFSALFSVPYSGKNSLYASVGEESNYNTYWDSNEGNHCVTQYTAQDSEHEITVCFDYLEGEHQNPATGQSQYLYQSVAVIRDI